MKLSPSSRKKQRRMLDRRLRELRPIASTPAPRTGWLRAVRQSLGMSAAQVAARLGLSAATVVELELREPAGKVSLQTLDRTARAMGCKLVYAVVPESSTSLEDMVHAQALRAARSICKRATQSMDWRNRKSTRKRPKRRWRTWPGHSWTK